MTPTVAGIVMGLAVCTVYALASRRRKATPNLVHACTLMLSSSAAVGSARFGYLAPTASAADLGSLADQRLPMVLGAFAVIWTALDAGARVFRHAAG
jgi:hypothetical protein